MNMQFIIPVYKNLSATFNLSIPYATDILKAISTLNISTMADISKLYDLQFWYTTVIALKIPYLSPIVSAS